MSNVLVKGGALHRFWPDHFAPPEICVKQAQPRQVSEVVELESHG